MSERGALVVGEEEWKGEGEFEGEVRAEEGGLLLGGEWEVEDGGGVGILC